MPIQKLPKIGLYSDLTTGSSGWGPKRNFNSNRLETLVSTSILGQVATSTALPAAPNDGDTYYVQDTKKLATYFNFSLSWFQDFTPIGLPVYNSTLDTWFYFDGFNLIPWPSGGVSTPPNWAESNETTSFVTTANTEVQMPDMDILGFNHNGNPLDLEIVPTNTSSGLNFSRCRIQDNGGGEFVQASLKIYANGIPVYSYIMQIEGATTTGPGTLLDIGIPVSSFRTKSTDLSSGVYDFTVWVKCEQVGTQFIMDYVKLIAYQQG